MGRTRKTAHASLGRALLNTKKSTMGDKSTFEDRHNTHEEKVQAMKSVTEESPYEEFIATATLAEKEFTAEKLNVKFVGLSVTSTSGPSINEGELDSELYLSQDERKAIVVPRRPKWTKEMTAEELDLAEKEAFLNWRRGMAHLQNKQDITPFERNIEVWRQLWRVVEKSDVVVQIVDARNPLLYRCEDLELYVKELGKKNIILINKADFLTEKQRKYWADFFNSVNLPHAFYSAATANEKLTSKTEDKSMSKEDSDSDSGEGESEEEEENPEDEQEQPDDNEAEGQENIDPQNETEYPILNREGLIKFLKSFKPDPAPKLYSVGLVGYPNVGKSSTINSLMGIKRTSVSATPGKTKHFQTLFLEEDLLLCDCPGLVMPAFGGSKGEMVLGGILPIDQLTSYSSPADLLVQRMSRLKLEKTYGVSLPAKYTGDDFLSAYAAVRGFMTVRGIPDSSRAARIVLKDYVNGKLRYCQAPPSVPQNDFQDGSDDLVNELAHIPENDEDDSSDEPVVPRRPPTLRSVNVEKRLDNNFFAPATSGVHFKGKHMVASGVSRGGSAPSSSSSSTVNLDKPWRMQNKRNKKEKLRRVYRHLDVE